MATRKNVKKQENGTEETLPPLIYADGALNSNIINSLKGQYSTISLFEGDREVILHQDGDNADTVRVSKAVWFIVTALVLAATSGKSMSTDGALLWLADERIRTSRNLEGLKKANWSVRITPTGQGGAERYEAPITLLDDLAMLRAQFVVPSVENWPARRTARESTKEKAEAVEVSFMA